MPYSYVDLLASGGQQNFSFSFPYLSRDHIHVFRIDNGTGQPFEYTDITFTNAFTVRLAAGAIDGEVVRVQRITPISGPLVDFVDGSALRESDLDAAVSQIVYVLQERLDQEQTTLRVNQAGKWDFLGKQATGLLTTDVIHNIHTQHNGIDRPIKPTLNFVDSGSLVFDVAHNPANNRIDVTATVVPEAPLEDLTANSISNSDVETTLATVTVPAGRMGVNSRLVIESLFTYQNDSGADRYVDLSVYVGGNKISTQQHLFTDANSNLFRIFLSARVQNLGSLSSQSTFAMVERMTGAVPSGSFEPAGLLSVNTAASFDVVVKGQLIDSNSTQVLTHRGTKITIV